jgi:hypothetical protein
VALRALRQFLVYDGLLEGLPTREMNEWTFVEVVTEERARRPHDAGPLLIRPEQRPIEYRGGERYPFGEPAAIPRVGCVGQFRPSPARDQREDYSQLVVIWFQNDFAPPIGREAWTHLRAIDWERHVTDYTD